MPSREEKVVGAWARNDELQKERGGGECQQERKITRDAPQALGVDDARPSIEYLDLCSKLKEN